MPVFRLLGCSFWSRQTPVRPVLERPIGLGQRKLTCGRENVTAIRHFTLNLTSHCARGFPRVDCAYELEGVCLNLSHGSAEFTPEMFPSPLLRKGGG